jgi:PPOX class probable F420-dependent enzyme
MHDLTDRQREILSERRIAAIATISADGLPHLTAVWFLFENDIFYVSISSRSAKMRNLTENPRVALMIDTREPYAESGICIQGRVEIIDGQEALEIGRKVHAGYLTPEALASDDIGGLFEAFDDIALKIEPSRWITWDMAEVDRQVFSGALRATNALHELAR